MITNRPLIHSLLLGLSLGGLLLTAPSSHAQSSGTGTTPSSSNAASNSPATTSSNSASNNPMMGRTGTRLGSPQTSGSQGLSNPDGEGGAGANESTAVKQQQSPSPTPSEVERGAAPAGASSAPKNPPLASGSASRSNDSQGSTTNGGTAPITGSRQEDTGGVGRSLSGLLPYFLVTIIVIVGVALGFMNRMKARKP